MAAQKADVLNATDLMRINTLCEINTSQKTSMHSYRYGSLLIENMQAAHMAGAELVIWARCARSWAIPSTQGQKPYALHVERNVRTCISIFRHILHSDSSTTPITFMCEKQCCACCASEMPKTEVGLQDTSPSFCPVSESLMGQTDSPQSHFCSSTALLFLTRDAWGGSAGNMSEGLLLARNSSPCSSPIRHSQMGL